MNKKVTQQDIINTLMLIIGNKNRQLIGDIPESDINASIEKVYNIEELISIINRPNFLSTVNHNVDFSNIEYPFKFMFFENKGGDD